MARRSTGVDVGTSGVRALAGHAHGTGFVATAFAAAENPGGTPAAGWGALAAHVRPRACRVGLTGRDVNVRYTRVPRVADWQLRRLVRFEAREIGQQSDAPVASDFNVLAEIPELEGEDVVLLAMARESLLEEHEQGLRAAGGTLDAFTPNAIALYNAFLRFGSVLDETVLVANLGASSIDVVLTRGTDLLLARNLGGGSQLFDAALAERFGVPPERAARYKETEASLRGAPFRDANQEKAYKALLAPAEQVASLLASTLSFCKAQLRVSSLKLDRVLLCGGGARLDGLPEHLRAALGVPVERFDPFALVDVSKLPGAQREALEARRLESVVALGLALSGSDPEAYSIEILPEALERRRAFRERGVFLLAAALLAVLFLGAYAWTQRSRARALGQEAARLESRLRGAERVDDETRALAAENDALAREARELFALASSGETLVRALAAVEASLPREFWLEGLTSTLEQERGAAGEERPLLRLSGRAREGTEATTELFAAFVAAVRARLDGLRVQERMGDTAAFFTLEVSASGGDGHAGGT